jgi:hypothetical protein
MSNIIRDDAAAILFFPRDSDVELFRKERILKEEINTVRDTEV